MLMSTSRVFRSGLSKSPFTRSPRPSRPVTRFKRSFHATPQCRISPIDSLCTGIYNVADFVHSTSGLSWAITIPLTALAVRAVFILPLNILGTTHRNKMIVVNPLIYAWRPRIMENLRDQPLIGGPRPEQRMYVKAMKKVRKTLYNRYDISRRTMFLAGFAQLPVWLLFMETLRKMCGTNEGLLGILSKASQNQDLDTGNDSLLTGVPFVESLANEGALWFPNLLVPDESILGLPAVLSGVTLLSIYISRIDAFKDGTIPGKWSDRWHRVLVIWAIAIAPATTHIPPALLIYWITSTISGVAQRKIVDRLFPRPPTAMPCKRIARFNS